MAIDSQNNDWIIGVIGLVVSSIIAYHVWFLSKRISKKAKLDHKKDIKNKIYQLLKEIYVTKSRRQRVYLIDIDVYEKYYPLNDNIFERDSHFPAGLKGLSYDGVEFFTHGLTVYKSNSGDVCFTKKNVNDSPINVQIVGLLPYDWIVDVEKNGDEHNTSSLIYCHFNNKSRWKFGRRELDTTMWKDGKPIQKTRNVWRIYRTWSPFKKYKYYEKSTVYEAGVDPYFCEFISIDVMN